MAVRIFKNSGIDPIGSLLSFADKKAVLELSASDLITLSAHLENIVATYYWLLTIMAQRYIDAVRGPGARVNTKKIIRKLMLDGSLSIDISRVKQGDLRVEFKHNLDTDIVELFVSEFGPNVMRTFNATYRTDGGWLLHHAGGSGASSAKIQLPYGGSYKAAEDVYIMLYKYGKRIVEPIINKSLAANVRSIVRQRDNEIHYSRSLILPNTVDGVLSRIKGARVRRVSYDLRISERNPSIWTINVSISDVKMMRITLTPYDITIAYVDDDGAALTKRYKLDANVSIKDVVQTFVEAVR